jgi:SAM-dependent methyltransferase
MPSDLERLRSAWTQLGQDDPLWAILSHPDKRGGRWDLDQFLAAGEVEIAGIDRYCAELKRPRQHRRALDFGCGVGRLSRALAARYDEVIGVDISPSMLARARELHADVHNLRFVENAKTQLDFVADCTIDLVYCVITLQHMPAALQLSYIGEFLRIIAPGGLAVFQIASGYSRDWRGLGYRLLPNRILAPLRRHMHASRAAAEMHVVDETRIVALAGASGKQVLSALDVDSAGTGFHGRLLFIGD